MDVIQRKIPIDKLFECALTNDLQLKLVNVSPYNLNIVQTQTRNPHDMEKTRNVIQISMTDRAIIWDLDNNCEIYSLYNIQEFNKV